MAIDVKNHSSILSPYKPRRLAVGEDDTMRITRDWPRCVMFLCVDRNTKSGIKRVPISTAFWVRVTDNDDKSISWKYIVTARHVIEERGEDDVDDNVHIRVNLVDGGYKDYPTNRSDWLTHDNADVALIDLLLPTEFLGKIDHLTIPLEMFLDNDYGYRGEPLPKDKSITVWPHLADEVFFIGLFTQHAGERCNLPIVRFGHISAFPIEPIVLPEWGGTAEFEQLAWLVECKSWGGHSGSPTFWVLPMPTLERKGKVEIWNIRYIKAFLGLVSGHFDVPKKLKTTGEYSYLGKIEAGLNAGIACVTPAEEVRQLLMGGDLVKKRQQGKRKIQSQRPKATLDMGQIGEGGITKEQFLDDLRKVSQKLPPPEKESS